MKIYQYIKRFTPIFYLLLGATLFHIFRDYLSVQLPAQAFEGIFAQKLYTLNMNMMSASLAAIITAFIFLLRKYKKEPLSRDKLRPWLKVLGCGIILLPLLGWLQHLLRF